METDGKTWLIFAALFLTYCVAFVGWAVWFGLERLHGLPMGLLGVMNYVVFMVLIGVAMVIRERLKS